MTRVEVLRRIEGLKGRLTQPTPAPLEGQQTIPVDDEPQNHDPDPVTQQPLW